MSTRVQLPTKPLGKDGPQVVRVGLGHMGAGTYYGMPASDKERLEHLDQAYRMGETFWDTADMYGDSEDLLGKWFAANPEKRKDIFLATKFANRGPPTETRVDSSPEYCREAIETSLNRLGLPFVDLYYVHRLDKVTPIEKTMQALVELKDAGKIKHIGLSECSAKSLRRAHAVHPISCVQMEYNPFCLEIESPQYRLLEVARELGVAVVAYSPLANGLLTGAIRSREDLLKPGDIRGWLPWFSEENIGNNLAIVDQIKKVAEAKGVTLAQLTLAWILKQGDDFFPIPGTTNPTRLAQNLESLKITVSDEEDRVIREAAKGVAGQRYPDAYMGGLFADTPGLE